MCSYDNMRVQVSPALIQTIKNQKIHDKSRINIYTKNILKILGCIRWWTIVVLILSPSYAVPLKRIVELQLSESHHSAKKGIVIQVSSESTHNPRPLNPVINSSIKVSGKRSVPSFRDSLRKSPFSINMDTTDLASRSRRSSGGENSCGGDAYPDHEASKGSWSDPCSNHNLMEVGSATREELSLHIMKAIVEANSQVENFIDHFSQQAFGAPWKEATEHNVYMFEFLNTLSGVDLRSDSVTFEDSLPEAYELMQRRAVGIEQATLDKALYQSNCLSKFRQLERRIISILCQLRHAMLSKGVQLRENVTKDIMPESSRSPKSEQSRNIRDAVILREYIESLHLLHAVFNNFSQPTTSSD